MYISGSGHRIFAWVHYLLYRWKQWLRRYPCQTLVHHKLLELCLRSSVVIRISTQLEQIHLPQFGLHTYCYRNTFADSTYCSRNCYIFKVRVRVQTSSSDVSSFALFGCCYDSVYTHDCQMVLLCTQRDDKVCKLSMWQKALLWKNNLWRNLQILPFWSFLHQIRTLRIYRTEGVSYWPTKQASQCHTFTKN